MCCGGGGDAPSSPDPYATANAQKKAYIESATANAYLNRMDETTPFGSVHYETMPDEASPAGPAPDYGGYDYLGGVFGAGSPTTSAPWAGQGTGPAKPWGGIPRMRKVTSLNPDEQAILDQSRGNKIRLGGMAADKIGEVGEAFGTPFSFDGAPGAGYGALDKLQALAAHTGPDLSAYEALAKQGGPKLDEAARQQVQDAMYRRETAELDPRFRQEQTDLETKLANQGVMQGSQAWNKATNQFSRQKNTTYGDALDRSILAGGAEQSRLFGLKSAKRAQNLGALQSLHGMQSEDRQKQLAAYGNLFGLKQAGRQNWLKEAMAKRQMPMDELNMLLGKSEGYNVPQFKNPSDINVGTPDIQSLISGDYKNKLDIWNQGQASDSAMTGNLIGGASSAAAAAMIAGLLT